MPLKRLSILCLSCLCLAATVFAQTQELEDDPDLEALRAQPISGDEFNLTLDPENQARVDALITRLSGPDFAEREKAASDLIEMGADAFSTLRQAYRQADDLESRLRIEEVVRTAYLNHHVLNRHGFLGISMGHMTQSQLDQVEKMQPAQFNQMGSPRLPEGRVGVFVSQVIADTGAARAGVLKNDILIGINGQPITGTGNDIRDSFSAIIRTQAPGARVQLELVRGQEVLTLEAILGRPPEDVAKNSNIIKVTPMYHVVSERFATWWQTYFEQDATAAAKPAAP
jgi:hypothetical protein